MRDRNTIWPRILDVNDSSQIDTISYDPNDDEMKVTFLNGTSYLYFNVPALSFTDICGAESVGKTFNKLLKTYKWQVEKLEG